VLVGNLTVLVVLLAAIGGCLVTDVGSLRSRAMHRKAERDAASTGAVGTWVDATAGADVLNRRYNRTAVVFGWIAIAGAVGVHLLTRA
jgi:hypothetical protein